jgi:hypothetical protein
MRIALAIFGLALSLSTQASPEKQQGPGSDPMAEFKYVLGTWRPKADPAKSAKFAEQYVFTPILDGKFVASQEILRDDGGKIVHRDFVVFGTDPDTHKLFLHAYNTDGSIDRTKAVDAPPGTWVFVGTVYGSSRFRDYRYTITRVEEDHMVVLIELLVNGKYEKLSEKRYERTSKDAIKVIQ